MEHQSGNQPNGLDLLDAWSAMPERERWALFLGAALMHSKKARFIFAATSLAVIVFVVLAATIDGSPAWVGIALLVGGIYGWVVSRISKYL
jgi:hypothetical protein